MFSQFSWARYFIFYKHMYCCSLKILIQHKPNWSEMGVIILKKEFFHIQIYISESKRNCCFLLQLIYRNKEGKCISTVASTKIANLLTLPTFNRYTLVMCTYCMQSFNM